MQKVTVDCLVVEMSNGEQLALNHNGFQPLAAITEGKTIISPREWHERMSRELLELGYIQYRVHPTANPDQHVVVFITDGNWEKYRNLPKGENWSDKDLVALYLNDQLPFGRNPIGSSINHGTGWINIKEESKQPKPLQEETTEMLKPETASPSEELVADKISKILAAMTSKGYVDRGNVLQNALKVISSQSINQIEAILSVTNPGADKETFDKTNKLLAEIFRELKETRAEINGPIENGYLSGLTFVADKLNESKSSSAAMLPTGDQKTGYNMDLPIFIPTDVHDFSEINEYAQKVLHHFKDAHGKQITYICDQDGKFLRRIEKYVEPAKDGVNMSSSKDQLVGRAGSNLPEIKLLNDVCFNAQPPMMMVGDVYKGCEFNTDTKRVIHRAVDALGCNVEYICSAQGNFLRRKVMYSPGDVESLNIYLHHTPMLNTQPTGRLNMDLLGTVNSLYPASMTMPHSNVCMCGVCLKCQTYTGINPQSMTNVVKSPEALTPRYKVAITWNGTGVTIIDTKYKGHLKINANTRENVGAILDQLHKLENMDLYGFSTIEAGDAKSLDFITGADPTFKSVNITKTQNGWEFGSVPTSTAYGSW